MESTFKVQELTDDTPTLEWGGKVHQYVSGLEEQSLFGSRPGSSVQPTT